MHRIFGNFGRIGLMLGAALIASTIAVVGHTTKHPESRLSALDLGFKPGECVSSNGILRCASPAIVTGCEIGTPDCRVDRASLDHRLSDRPTLTLAKLDQRMTRHTADLGRQPEGVSSGLPRRPD